MQLIFGRSKWDSWHDPVASFCARVKADGWDATEIFLPTAVESGAEIADIHARHDLQLIGQIVTRGETLDEARRLFDQDWKLCLAARPLLMNCHSGRDVWSTADNVALMRHYDEVAAASGIMLLHEVHRSRATFSSMATMDLLDAYPSLRFTADLSHWCCVHASLLDDRPKAVDRLIAQAYHIHARVGHQEAAQVSHPAAPEWKQALDAHLGWWHRIIAARRAEGRAFLTITPEFGPPGYQPTIPFTNMPTGDLWQINRWMRDTIRNQVALSLL